LYSLAIQIYLAAMKMAAFFHTKARKWVDGRIGLIERLKEEIPALKGNRPVAWFHAASLGEFEQGRPVLEEFRNKFPDYFILLTFFSPSGYEVRKNYKGADYICYLPADTKGNAKQFVDIFQPRITFFIKYEFWYHYLSELQKRSALIISFSAIFRKDQLFFKWYGGSYRKTLTLFDHLFVQNEESARLLSTIGIQNVTRNGDTRFDRVLEIAKNRLSLPEIASFVAGEPCLVVGSAWEEDMQKVIIPYLNRHSGHIKLKVIIAPHEISDDSITKWSSQLKMNSLRYSDYKSAGFKDELGVAAGCLFIDNIGMLSSLYQYGTVAFVGGAFGSGLHNILEAVTYGIPVFFGSEKYEKFQEAIDLIEAGGAVAVHNEAEFSSALNALLMDRQRLEEKGGIAARYIHENAGAVLPIMEFVDKKLNSV